MSNAEHNTIDSAIDAGRDLAKIDTRIKTLGNSDVPVALVGIGQKLEVMTEYQAVVDARADAPRRRKGVAHHTELKSFTEHANRFKSEPSAIWADISTMKLTAVFDYHPADGAAWCGHQAVYECPRSQPWQEWTANDGQSMTQDDFAEFLESHLEDLVGGKKGESFPQPMAMLEMARNLQLHTKGRFERRIHPTTNDYDLVCKQETESTSTPIPRAFLLGLRVFEGGEHYQVEARIRLKVRDGVARFTYLLHRRAEIEREAFGDIRKAVADATSLPVFAGTAER